MKIWDNKTKSMVEFIPSPTGEVIVMKADGSKHKHPANRAERRRLAKESQRIQKRNSKKEQTATL